MPRGNRIIQISLAFLFLGCTARGRAEPHPIVPGYERFHAEVPDMEGGRMLFNELGCVQCHDRPTGLPERKGPNLDGVLQRAHPNWVRSFLKDPAAIKPGTSMPRMHLTDQEVEAVLHYLGSLKPLNEIPDAFRFVNAERGMSLYHEMGCVACHEPSPDFHPAEGKPGKADYDYPHVPLPDLAAKYDFDSLNAFLYQSHDFRPRGRMPQFKLEREDGGDLTAFLLDYQNGDSTEYPAIPKFKVRKSLAEIGRIVVESRHCIACHDFPDTEKPEPSGIVPINREFIDFTQLEDHPTYNLTANQTASIKRFLEGNPSEPAPAISHMQALNCLACHTHGNLGGPDAARKIYFTGDHDLGDTGRLPPPLTDIGSKLKPDWLETALTGKSKVRPYLRVQMPNFGTAVEELTQILVREAQSSAHRELPSGDSEAGRKLLGTLGGLNCITCHDWNERRSLGIGALNIGNMAQRLQPGWLQDYLINPDQYRPNTLMPSFWPSGVASNQELLQGDTTAQIASIYAFAERGADFPEGFPAVNSTKYEIIPSERPVVQRSFMEGVGTHAILVGFPEAVHLAFDGRSGQPAMMWKGRFFDAYRTWFSRFPEFEDPLGEDVVRWKPVKASQPSNFRGYRLDSAGIPEFILSIQGAEAYERFIPVTDANGKTGLQRVIRYTQERQLGDVRRTHPKSVTVKEVKDQDPMTRIFIYQW